MLPCYGFCLIIGFQLAADFHKLDAFCPVVQEKRITDRTSYLAHFFRMAATVQLTLRRVFCLHYRTSLPPGSRINVQGYYKWLSVFFNNLSYTIHLR
jgi:hypothetical protein